MAWTAGGNLAAPAGFEYRRGNGHGSDNSVTFFSGLLECELVDFISLLSSMCADLIDKRGWSALPPHSEWDPHQMPIQESTAVDAVFRELNLQMALPRRDRPARVDPLAALPRDNRDSVTKRAKARTPRHAA